MLILRKVILCNSPKSLLAPKNTPWARKGWSNSKQLETEMLTRDGNVENTKGQVLSLLVPTNSLVQHNMFNVNIFCTFLLITKDFKSRKILQNNWKNYIFAFLWSAEVHKSVSWGHSPVVNVMTFCSWRTLYSMKEPRTIVLTCTWQFQHMSISCAIHERIYCSYKCFARYMNRSSCRKRRTLKKHQKPKHSPRKARACEDIKERKGCNYCSDKKHQVCF